MRQRWLKVSCRVPHVVIVVRVERYRAANCSAPGRVKGRRNQERRGGSYALRLLGSVLHMFAMVEGIDSACAHYKRGKPSSNPLCLHFSAVHAPTWCS